MTPSPPTYLDTGLALAQIEDPAAVRTILQLVEETLQRDIPRIAQVLEQGDVTGANRLLHPLKGSLPIFASAALCAQLSAVEALSKQESSAIVAKAYAELQPRLVQLLAEVSHYLGTTD